MSISVPVVYEPCPFRGERYALGAILVEPGARVTWVPWEDLVEVPPICAVLREQLAANPLADVSPFVRRLHPQALPPSLSGDAAVAWVAARGRRP